MKIYRLPQLAELAQDKRVELGKDELGTANIGLRYQTLSTGAQTRIAKTSSGREEIIYIVKGTVQATVKKSTFTVSAGEAFYSDKEVDLENCTDTEAAFITASAPAPVFNHNATGEKTVSPAAPTVKDKGIKENTDPDVAETATTPAKEEKAEFIISGVELYPETGSLPEVDFLTETGLSDENRTADTALITAEGIYTTKKIK